MEDTMEHLTLDTFKEKVCECGLDGGKAEWNYKGSLPAVIDFYADWCGPCKMVAPILEELSGEYEGRLNVYKVDTEAQQQLAAMFGITSIPSILFIPTDGKPQMAAGALPKQEFKRMFREILGVEESVTSP
jgi:thioredoxin